MLKKLFKKACSFPRWSYYLARRIYFRVVTSLPKSFSLFENWWLYAADVLGLIRNNTPRQLRLKNGQFVWYRPGTFDYVIMIEIFGCNDYFDRFSPFEVSSVKNVLDIGAQIGTFSLRASQLFPDAKVVAVEATSANFAMLEKNISANNLQSRIKAVKKALWGKTGETIKMHISSENSGGHSAVVDHNISGKETGVESIQTISLEDLLKTNGMDSVEFMKMDIEGAEYEVIYSTPKDVLQKITRMVFEAHPIDKENKNADALVSYLRANGYVVEIKGRYVWAEKESVSTKKKL